MKIQHRPHHWIAVALALAVFLLTLSEVHGQSTGSTAVFEGRPAMAGAQGGLGAQAGPPQGGIGVQGTDAAQRSVDPRRPGVLDDVRRGEPAAAGTDVAAASSANTAGSALNERPQRGDNVKPAPDKSIAKDQRSATKKAKRAAKRTITRSRHGVSEIDSGSAASPR